MATLMTNSTRRQSCQLPLDHSTSLATIHEGRTYLSPSSNGLEHTRPYGHPSRRSISLTVPRTMPPMASMNSIGSPDYNGAPSMIRHQSHSALPSRPQWVDDAMLRSHSSTAAIDTTAAASPCIPSFPGTAPANFSDDGSSSYSLSNADEYSVVDFKQSMLPVCDVTEYSPLEYIHAMEDTSSGATQSCWADNPTEQFAAQFEVSQFGCTPLMTMEMKMQSLPLSRTSTALELTDASPLSSEMTRDNSWNTSTTSGADLTMVRSDSSFSNISDFNFTAEQPPLGCSDVPLFSHVDVFGEEQSSLAQFSSPMTGVSPHQSPLSFTPCNNVQSRNTAQRNDAGNPTQSRLSLRHQEQLMQSSRPIAAKVANDQKPVTIKEASDHRMMRITSRDGHSKEVAEITKVPYIRPSYPKLQCDLCNEYPDGFRGEHEIRRHKERVHSTRRRVWVTIDASPDGKFLANCKHCTGGKKYHAYYNCAAHLRRAHFNPRKRGRKSKRDEKRGGKGGGDWPKMDLLKSQWMKEIYETVDPVEERNDGVEGESSPLEMGEAYPSQSSDDMLDTVQFDVDFGMVPEAAAGYGFSNTYPFDPSVPDMSAGYFATTEDPYCFPWRGL